MVHLTGKSKSAEVPFIEYNRGLITATIDKEKAKYILKTPARTNKFLKELRTFFRLTWDSGDETYEGIPECIEQVKEHLDECEYLNLK